MKIVISHPHGNQNTSEAIKSLEKANLLDSFWTTIAFPFNLKILSKKFYNINYKKIKLRYFKELFRQLCILFKIKKLYYYDENVFSVYSVYKDLDTKVSRYLNNNIGKINAIYTYEDCALNSFKLAKKNKIKTIYDLTSPYWLLRKKIIEEELNLQPDWNLSSTEILTNDKCVNKDQEILLSDKIIVASSFTAKSLELFKEDIKSKIKIIPYGINCSKKNLINKRRENEEFKLIFAGRPTLTQGIQYIIEILQQVDFPWKIEIVGSLPEKPANISEKLNLFFKNPRCEFTGQISNKELIQRMQRCHLFVFPSLYEGFGQVILEALSCSLPVITTYNTGGSDIIDHGKDGFLTPIRDTKKTTEILNNLYHDEEYRQSIAQKAFLKANCFTWTKYQNEINKIVKVKL